jgi:hypothetical protein
MSLPAATRDIIFENVIYDLHRKGRNRKAGQHRESKEQPGCQGEDGGEATSNMLTLSTFLKLAAGVPSD